MTFFDQVKEFVRSVTTNDHYAAYDRRDTQHASLKSSYPMHAPSAEAETRYSAGSRTASLNNLGRGGSANNSTSDIALGAYPDGREAPSAAVAWERIDRWLASYYPELDEMIHDGSTENDLDELEHDLDCVLPRDVREHFLAHDGQDSTGRPTGLVYSMEMLDLESVVEEWTIWRNTALKINQMTKAAAAAEAAAAAASSASASASSASASTSPGPSNPAASTPSDAAAAASHAAAAMASAGAGGSASKTRKWLENQRSVPPGAIQTVYAHPGWIPLAKDGEGNNIAVDLAPGKQGAWGQIILFGRDFDTKYVIAPNWGSFLVQFADDLEAGNWFIDDDIEEPVFAFKQGKGPLVSYLTVLRGRSQRQYGFAVSQTSQQQAPRPAAPLVSTSTTSLPRQSRSGSRNETIIKLLPPEPVNEPVSKGNAATKSASVEDTDSQQQQPLSTVPSSGAKATPASEPKTKEEPAKEAETKPEESKAPQTTSPQVSKLGDDLQNVDLAAK